ncbi:polysaccharide deacetylase family protein [Marinoscillum sp.]|uniref:polysaccharide deacetylase family protein n=1 Tax=Marinoscillum sp. TaxID=2024838 RepID=UPI003BA9EB49
MKQLIVLLAVAISLKVTAQKQVVITIDDLISNGPFRDLAHIQQVNRQVLDTALKYDVPVIGFVNEGKLFREGEEQDRKQILKDWLEAGMDLGNHTYSHPSLYNTPLDDYKEEVLKGGIYTSSVLEDAGSKMRYFRHPYLNTGPDSTTRASFEAFLAAEGYTIAPVTVESSDYVFNKLYANAVLEGDTAEMKVVGETYVSHTLRMFDWMEAVADTVVGRAIPHTYLCHVNPLNANYLGAIYQGLIDKGYEFITLEKALEDEAYSKTDYHIGQWGVSWLYRWDKGNVQKWLMTEPAIDPEILRKYQE